MTGYRIHPDGVQKVLTTTQTDADAFQTILSPLQGHVEAAAAGTANSGAIVPALQSFFEIEATGLKSISNRVGAGLTGAFQATKAYCDGDLEMVKAYEKQAYDTANPAPRRGNRGMYAE